MDTQKNSITLNQKDVSHLIFWIWTECQVTILTKCCVWKKLISCKSVDKTNNQLNTRYKFKRFLHGVFFYLDRTSCHTWPKPWKQLTLSLGMVQQSIHLGLF